MPSALKNTLRRGRRIEELVKKHQKKPSEEPIERETSENRSSSISGECAERAWGAQNSVTRRSMIADKSLLQVNSGLSLTGKKRNLLTIVLDCSMSMEAELYSAIRNGLKQFMDILHRTEAFECTGISLITIERSQIHLRRDFQSCRRNPELPNPYGQCRGLSPIISATYLAFLRSALRKKNYAHGGIACGRPVVAVFSDFCSNDHRYNGMNEVTLQAMIKEMQEMDEVHLIKVNTGCTEEEQSLLKDLPGTEVPIQGEGTPEESAANVLYALYRQLCETLELPGDDSVTAEDFLENA